eukprot:336003-Pleurochrysis_carterae.AAC.4
MHLRPLRAVAHDPFFLAPAPQQPAPAQPDAASLSPTCSSSLALGVRVRHYAHPGTSVGRARPSAQICGTQCE